MSNSPREKEIYKYLFYLATILKKENKKSNKEKDKKSNKEKDKKPNRGKDEKYNEEKNINFRQTSIRLGLGEKSDFAIAIYDFINDQESKYTKPKDLTTEELIERIKNIKSNSEDSYKKDKSNKFPKILRKEDILTLLGYLVNLSPKEREDLGLTKSEADTILQQALLNISRYENTEERQEKFLKIYKESIAITKEEIITSEFLPKDRENFIIEATKKYLDFLGLQTWKNKLKKQEELFKAINRHLLRLESQAGIRQFPDKKASQKFRKNYLTKEFLQKLIHSTIDNYIIRESIPIYIQYFNIEQLPPLPLYFPDEQYFNGLLNPDFNHSHDSPDNTGLASHSAYKVSISFNLKIYDKKLLEKITNRLTPEVKVRLIKEGKEGLVFTVSSFGVGGQLSQLIKIINRALFWDVECLRNKYFPIAHDLVINQDIIKNNIVSPLWCHNLVRLCRQDYLKQALMEGKSYEECAHIDEIATGDYCGFNLIESSIKSALQARLAAIIKTHIDTKQYIEDLAKTIERREILRVAEDYLNYYPFSLSAIKSYLETHLLNKEEKKSYFYYDAYLTIIEAFLREGLYRKSYEYLSKIQELENISLCNLEKDFEEEESSPYSSTTLVKYEICKANYFYLCHSEDPYSEYKREKIETPCFDIHPYNRAMLINKAWECLEKAEKHLEIRIEKYSAINEISQSIFTSHFILSAKINFLRAKLFLFFPSYATTHLNSNDDRRNYHYARICYLENSKIYAAKNADTVAYACYTACQVFAYIMTGYLENKKVKLNSQFNDSKTIDLTRENCLKWAKRLRDNSLISYAEFGRKCYYQIKEKSGVDISQIYGNISIDPVPLIQEVCDRNLQGYDKERQILGIDMSLLFMKKLDNSSEELEEYIYIFGAKAAIILFARAIYELCGDENTQTQKQWQKKLDKAYRLFSYAWGTAENGCEIKENQDNNPANPTLVRPDFTKENDEDDEKARLNRELFPEATSIRDLYPHRQSEIADIGKVYAIACNLLLLYLISDTEEQTRKRDQIEELKNQFCKISRSNDGYFGQSNFNYHLKPYFDRIKNIVQDELKRIEEKTHTPDPKTGMPKIRDRIMKNFFSAFA